MFYVCVSYKTFIIKSTLRRKFLKKWILQTIETKQNGLPLKIHCCKKNYLDSNRPFSAFLAHVYKKHLQPYNHLKLLLGVPPEVSRDMHGCNWLFQNNYFLGSHMHTSIFPNTERTVNFDMFVYLHVCHTLYLSAKHGHIIVLFVYTANIDWHPWNRLSVITLCGTQILTTVNRSKYSINWYKTLKKITQLSKTTSSAK